MGTQSFLLISCVDNKNIEAAEKLNKIYGVKEAVPVYGTYDCIAKTDKLEPGEVNTLVSSNIRPLEHVSSVLVLREEAPTNSRGMKN